MTNHEKHILLWDTLHKTGSDDKDKVFSDLFPEVFIGVAYDNSCWACNACLFQCEHCPIDWGTGRGRVSCCVENTLYMKWDLSESKDERKLLAAQIRDLPWRTK
jgi:hypothetical protein